ncbi:PRM10 [Candida pseudojiufengensis]|uniref:PRM10 n=1 Tax=Candida pseudojiufengensis TaxID=497109 RepID=UPI0022259CB3|nr:PRM10 [Candida pseudojiufengensis]KAI5959871.1 PRM10 [Candida pseudojiufengensis]
MSNNYSSSSDDEGGFNSNSSNRFHIQLPQQQLNLNEIRKQNQKKDNSKFTKQTSSNFIKVSNKLNNKKNVKFPDSYTPKDPRSSMNLSNTSQISSDDDDDENEEERRFYNESSNTPRFQQGQQNLPHFQFNSDQIKKNNNQLLDSSDDEDYTDFHDQTHTNFTNMQPPEHFYNTDSSDDEEEDSRKRDIIHTDDDPLSDKPENPLQDPPPHIYDQPIHKTTTSSSRKSVSSDPKRKSSLKSILSGESKNTSNSGNGPGGIKGILRKMSLADHIPSSDHDISQNDTFLGRVFSMGHNGISGGGLAPGASRMTSNDKIPEEDEEKRVGFAENENDRDNAIEMKPIANFEELSEEAKNLIHQHIPDSILHSRDSSAANSTDITPVVSQENLNKENKEGNDDDSSNNSGSTKKDEDDDAKKNNPFYTPNPDLFLRGNHDDDQEHVDQNDFLQDVDGDYIERPKHVQAGVLSSLLRLYQNPNEGKSSSSLSQTPTNLSDEYSMYSSKPQSSSQMDFNKFKNGMSGVRKGIKSAPGKVFKAAGGGKNRKSATFDKELNDQTGSGSDTEGGGSGNGGTVSNGEKFTNDTSLPSFHNAKPKMPKKRTTDSSNIKLKKLKHNRKAERLRITVHIADILQRQRFIMNMCRALMMFGAPTHRLEEYMIMTSRVLEIDGQFMYFPGCMLTSFGDAATRTSEVHLVRCSQGLNLGKLADTHRIYKAVIHDLIGVEEASKKLDELLKEKNKFPPWLCVFFYGLGSLAVTPFAFEGGWIDLPISFGVGLCVGYLQFYLSSMSHLYSSVFEVSAAIVVAFISRGIGSIKDGNLFCFSAITQGSLALILPGYIILCGSLELQSRNLVAGSVRMFYAIIYSLFLGFGITLGSALYGWVDHNATSQNSCLPGHSMNDKFRILFVPLFAICLGLINQAKFRQLPIMTVIACVGYIGTYFAGKHFSSVTEFTACIGAFIVGILGNLYSRIWKGMAVSAMLPAIFVQVPSGIASKSTLISGLQQADQITNKNGTSTTTTTVTDGSSLSFGATMVEVSIGISVGLFAAALFVYPFGKKRTGLFTL